MSVIHFEQCTILMMYIPQSKQIHIMYELLGRKKSFAVSSYMFEKK